MKWAVGLAVVILATTAHAQHSSWTPSRAQGVVLARIVTNEASGMLWHWDDAEIDLEIQNLASVVRNNRGRIKAHGWLGIMGALAPHVTRKVEPTQYQHTWTGELVGCTDARPPSWDREKSGRWRAFAPLWIKLCKRVVETWLSPSFVPTPEVISWGNLADTQRSLCRPTKRRRLCLVARPLRRGNYWFARNGSTSCTETWNCEEHP